VAGSTGEILKSLGVNTTIAIGKGIAAVITGSGAMLAETLHSAADCGNQILLLIGVKASKKPPDKSHPLGYGRTMYFYSFIVALMLFFGGGVFSVREGIHKIIHPEEVGDIRLAIGILAGSLVLEGWTTWGNIKVLNERRGPTPFLRYLAQSKDSDLIVVFGENSAAVLGLLFAMFAIIMSKVTGYGEWDAIGSLGVGIVLLGVAAFLGREVKSLMIGEAADENIIKMVDELALHDPNVESVFNVITVQQGPGEIIIAMKIKMRPMGTSEELCEAINTFEREMKAKEPTIKWSFIEPDTAA